LPPLEGFDWLAGCWLSRDGVVERWESVTGASISGSTLMPHADGDQVAQSLRIATTDAGGVSLYAQVGSQPARVFPLMTSSESLAVFEDPLNGDIRRITYRREGERLTLIIQAPDDEAWETHYEPCATPGL